MTVIAFPVQSTETINPKAYQPDYSIQYGQKYQRGRDIKDIAKLVRRDLKAAIQAKTLPGGKYSVTIDRFSGGQSLDVKVSNLKTPFLMQNPERILLENCKADHCHPTLPRFSKRGKAYLDTIEFIVAAYNFDGSDTNVDYWNVNFYSNTGFDSTFLQEERRQIIESVC